MTLPPARSGISALPRLPYREFAPPSTVRADVVCFWNRPADASRSDARIIPDGCIDIIWAGELPPFVAGPMTSPALPKPAAGAEMFGVRFQPGIAPALLGVSASELRDQHVPLRDIWPHDQYRSWTDVSAENDAFRRIDVTAAAIVTRLKDVREPDLIVVAAARWIAHQPSGSLKGLATLSSLSDRQVRRRFDDAIGFGPKTLQRILRTQRLLWLASQSRNHMPTLGQLAVVAGYADQAHMTREVTALTGASPRTLLHDVRARSAVSDLFKTPTR